MRERYFAYAIIGNEGVFIKPTNEFLKRKGGIINACKALIPQKIPNKTVLGVLKILSILPVPMIVVAMNHIYNTCIFYKKETEGGKMIYDGAGYIENQNEWKDVNFGFFYHMKYSGCEIIAAYNALLALGEAVSVQTMINLISRYERCGAVLGGLFGVSPYAVKAFFVKIGYHVTTTVCKDAETINKIGENSDTVIVTAYNNAHNILGQIHTVSITKESNGTYCIHNAYHRVNGKYAAKSGCHSLQDAIDAISNSEPSSICVIGISRRSENSRS